jgi:hypothetical protein
MMKASDNNSEFTAEGEQFWTRGHFVLFVRLLCSIAALDEYTAIAGWRTEVRRYKFKNKNKLLTAEILVVVPLVSFAFLQKRSVERARQELARCFLFHFSF